MNANYLKATFVTNGKINLEMQNKQITLVTCIMELTTVRKEINVKTKAAYICNICS